jgi:glutamine cyclotransferase
MNLKLLATLALPSGIKEGWGITHDANYLYISNGSPYIYIIDPSTFTVKSYIYVKDSLGRGVTYLNELEMVNNTYIYANQFTTNNVYKINKSTG